MTVFNAVAARILVGATGTLVGAIICFGTAVAPAAARQATNVRDGGVPTVTVPYADLDLASAAGRTTLRRRINYAAHDVCDVDRAARSIDIYTAQRECVRRARDSATMPVRAQIAIATPGR